MIITCPHCQTRYQVAAEAIGARGRQVQCAHCMQAWQATPVAPAPREVPKPAARRDDTMFDEMSEQQLDAAIEAEARAAPTGEVAAKASDHGAATDPPSKLDQALQRKRQRAFSRRQDSLTRRLPLARMRRMARIVALTTLVVVLCSLYFLRTAIVRQVPDMAGVYEKLGLAVNVVGLQFRDVRTLHTLREGKDVLIVNARIFSETGGSVIVPPVIVTLLAANGAALYAWSVTPAGSDLAPGEIIDFETQLTAPPDGAARVKLTFADGRVQSEAPAAMSEVGH